MTRFLAWLMIASLTTLFGPAAIARGDDPVCDDAVDECLIVVVEPGSPSDPKPREPGTPTKKVVPACSSVAADGVVAPIGVTLADLGLDDADHTGWVRMACLLAGEEMWLWFDPAENAESIARTLLARLQLQPPKIGWTPTTANAMGYVGVPTWLWIAEPGRLTWGPATISAAGVSLTARAESVTWSMGNGDEVRCANKGTPWRKGMGTDPSPTCGYLYERQGTYRVTATVHWVARWSGYGRSGAIPLSLSQERTLEVGEIQVIVNR